MLKSLFNSQTKKAAFLSLLLLGFTLPFQNCSESEFKSANSGSDTTITPPAPSSCTEITTANEILSMKSGSTRSPNSYCLTKDLDFSRVQIQSPRSYLRNIFLDGKNFKITGLNLNSQEALFGDISNSNIKNLVIGDTNNANTVRVSTSPGGIFANSIRDSNIENIQIINPINSQTVTSTKSCALFAGTIDKSNIKDVKIEILQSLNFTCNSLGLFAASTYNSEFFKLSNIQIKSQRNLTAQILRSGSLFITSGYIPHLDGIKIDVNNLDLVSGASTQNSFGALIASMYFNDFKTIDFNNINIKANLNLKNTGSTSALVQDCGGFGVNALTTLHLSSITINTDIIVNNSEYGWPSGTNFGQICGSTDIDRVNITDTYINSRLRLDAQRTTTYAAGMAAMGGLFGRIDQRTQVNLNLNRNSFVYLYTLTDQASKINKGKYSYDNNHNVILSPSSKVLNTLYNDVNLN